MRVLVTGHDGYIGTALAPMLAAAGHDVTGLDTSLYAGCALGRDEPLARSLTRDIRDVTIDDLHGFEAVVHLAALSNDPLGDLSPDLTYAINHAGTVRLAELAREAGVRRFVFASSCSMYGASGSDDMLDEDAPLRPLTPYAESKVRAEADLRALADADFAPTYMRNATAYGWSPRLRLDIVLNNLAAWAHTTGSIRLLSDGSAWRPLVHIRDIASATMAILDAPESVVRNEAFNIGTGQQNYRIRDLADVLAVQLPACSVVFADDVPTDPRSYRVDFSKLERTFPGLTLQWDAEKGALELLDAYRDHGLTLARFEGREFVRLRQLRHLLDSGDLDAELRWAARAKPMRTDARAV